MFHSAKQIRRRQRRQARTKELEGNRRREERGNDARVDSGRVLEGEASDETTPLRKDFVWKFRGDVEISGCRV